MDCLPYPLLHNSKDPAPLSKEIKVSTTVMTFPLQEGLDLLKGLPQTYSSIRKEFFFNLWGKKVKKGYEHVLYLGLKHANDICASHMALMVKNPHQCRRHERYGSIPGWGRSLEEGMAIYSSILA